MTNRSWPGQGPSQPLGGSRGRARRVSVAFVLGLSLVVSSTGLGLAGESRALPADGPEDDAMVARVIGDAISSQADADAGPGADVAASPAVDPLPTPTPDPLATPTPDPTATPTPDPLPTPTPDPLSTPTPDPTATPTPDPTATPTPDPTATPVPTPTPTPEPTPTPTPEPTPTPTPVPTPTPEPTITPPPRPATVDARVPSSVLKSLKSVPGDKARPYFDGCHATISGSMPTKSCLYGHLASHTTIALYGDSHALAWFPALLRVVNDRGWRLLVVTKSACNPADITPYDPATGVMRSCITFRKAAIAKMTRYHAKVIIVTGTRGFQTVDASGHVLTGSARTTAWMNGMKRTIAKLLPITRRVVLLADTPITRFTNPAGCIAAHPLHELDCATPVAKAVNYSWLNTEYHVALYKHVAFIDAERWVCPTSPCPLVRGSIVVYRNPGHLTATYAGSMWRKLESALLAVFADPRVIIGP